MCVEEKRTSEVSSSSLLSSSDDDCDERGSSKGGAVLELAPVFAGCKDEDPDVLFERIRDKVILYQRCVNTYFLHLG